jgi:integrase
MEFNAAVDDALIQRTPCSGVNLPRRIETEKRFLGVEELHHVADIIDPRHRTLVLTAGYTGARFGELAALQPQDLDLSRRRVTITRSLAEVRGIITETEPKTAASKRSITLPEAVADDLAAHLDHTPPDVLTGCSEHPMEARCDAAASGNDSGSPPWQHPSASLAGFMT